jgi:hypothetical protein
VTEEPLIFRTGDAVHKPAGYPFPGVVVSAFRTRAGKARYVVEHDHAHGLMHIFNARQLALTT